MPKRNGFFRKALAALCILSAVCLTAGLLATHLSASPATAAIAARGEAHGQADSLALPSGTVDVNTADEQTLETLSGVGPVLAQAIVDERAARGAFTYPEDLLMVSGIGVKKLAGFYDQLDFTASSLWP